MSTLSPKRVPWTERFRPRTLEEVILTKNQRGTLEDWWRSWVIWWNMRLIWSRSYGKKWREFIQTDDGKKWMRNYLKKWQDYFNASFERNVKKIGFETFFELISARSKKVSLNLKRNAKQAINNLLQDIWNGFLGNIKNEDYKINIMPPFPPYKPILLVGPPGTGKTTSIYALAWQEGIVVVEFNASDKRNASIINSVVREATRNVGFTETMGYDVPPRIILLDEIDGLNAREDRGGFSAILKVINQTKFPVAFTANVMHDRKVRMLMAYCVTVFFNRPADYQIEKLINMIASKVKMEIPEDVKKTLKKYAPDFRTVVYSLETYYYTKKIPYIYHDEMFSVQDAIRLAFSYKVMSNGKIDILKTVYKIQDYFSSIEGWDPRDAILWSWENASSFVERKNLLNFYRFLSRSDYLYRIGSLRGNWRIAYRDALNILAIGMAKYGKHITNIWAMRKIKIQKPTIIEQLGRLKQLMEGKSTFGESETEGGGLKPLLDKYARKTHISRKDAWFEMKFISFLAKNKPETVGKLFAQLYVPKESVEAFLNHFLRKEKNETRKAVLIAYDDELGRIGPKVVSLRGMGETFKESDLKEKDEKKEKEKIEKEKDKQKMKRLDEFFG